MALLDFVHFNCESHIALGGVAQESEDVDIDASEYSTSESSTTTSASSESSESAPIRIKSRPFKLFKMFAKFVPQKNKNLVLKSDDVDEPNAENAATTIQAGFRGSRHQRSAAGVYGLPAASSLD